MDMPPGNERESQQHTTGRLSTAAANHQSSAMSTALKAAAVNTLTTSMGGGKLGGPAGPPLQAPVCMHTVPSLPPSFPPSSSSSSLHQARSNGMVRGLVEAAANTQASRAGLAAVVEHPPLVLKAAPGNVGFANTSVTHPLDPLSIRELEAAGALAGQALASKGLESVASIRLADVSLHEPDKYKIIDYQGTTSLGLPRMALATAFSVTSGKTYRILVDLHAQSASKVEHVPNVQPPFTPEDYESCESIVRSHAGFRTVVSKAGYNPDKVIVDPWSVGYFGPKDCPSKRLAWALMYYKAREEDNTYARPLDGLKVVVDLLQHEVVEFVEEAGGVRVAALDEARYMSYTPPQLQRQDLKDLIVVQPDGPSFSLRGHHLHWQNWTLRLGFTAQEGLVLQMVGFNDKLKAPGGIVRPILYRLSFAEMVVPYGDPDYPHYKKNAFDAGEDGLGCNAHSLSLGCDCLGHIHYLDANLGPMAPGGPARVIRNAVCIHEEDAGMLWKHKDYRTDTSEVRRARRLVVSFMCTIGNYDYGFYYHLMQDGTIEMEVKLTGILSVGNLGPADLDPASGGHRPYGTTLHCNRKEGTGLFAPLHQHIFCARFDTCLDGVPNRLKEMDSHPCPPGRSNPHHNAWTVHERLLTSEMQAQRDADLEKERFWLVESSGATNRTGKPTAYKLMARDPIKVMAQPQAAFMRRAGYTRHTLWATAYHPQERYPAGEFPNQDPRPVCGLPLYAAKDRPLVDKDLVLWHVFGAHHVPRLEDWPLMPFEKVSCIFRPFGFFDASPVMDVPVASKRQMLLSTSNHHSHSLPGQRGHHHKSQSLPDTILLQQQKQQQQQQQQQQLSRL